MHKNKSKNEEILARKLGGKIIEYTINELIELGEQNNKVHIARPLFESQSTTNIKKGKLHILLNK